MNQWFIDCLFDKYSLNEDIVEPDEKIKPYNSYNDGEHTRLYLASALENMISDLTSYKFVNRVKVTASDKRGLSIYPQIKFDLPTECTNHKLNKHKIRVSEHPFQQYRGWQTNIETLNKTLNEIKEQSKLPKTQQTNILNNANTF